MLKTLPFLLPYSDAELRKRLITCAVMMNELPTVMVASFLVNGLVRPRRSCLMPVSIRPSVDFCFAIDISLDIRFDIDITLLILFVNEIFG